MAGLGALFDPQGNSDDNHGGSIDFPETMLPDAPYAYEIPGANGNGEPDSRIGTDTPLTGRPFGDVQDNGGNWGNG